MISITLPSIHPPALERALANIRETTRGRVEVIVVSPFPARIGAWGGGGRGGGEIIWIEERDSEGANAAHATALCHATGDFVLAWVDDHALAPEWDRRAIDNFLEGESWLRGAARNDMRAPFCLGLRQVWPQRVGTCFGNYYPYFPLMRRADAARGLWLTGEYRVGFADCDLGMRVWSAGGRCEWSRETLVTVLSDDERKVRAGPDWIDEAHTTERDMALFVERWANRYGAGYDTASLRGFNVDVDVPAGARTIWKGVAS